MAETVRWVHGKRLEKKMTSRTLPLLFDAHVHLRQDALLDNIVPTVHPGGVGMALVMPNLTPPIGTTDQALAYKQRLDHVDQGNTRFLMTLYLSADLTPEEVRKAAAHGITGIKSYPKGVTTNSDGGIEDYVAYYPVFKVMEECDLILHLHGEIPPGISPVCYSNENKH